jgi:hypothetical protein
MKTRMSERLPALPDDAILVHIGPHKTGTTAIQTTLASSRAMLREAGIFYQGQYSAHHRQAMALRQYCEGQGHGAESPPPLAVWEELARQAAETPGRVVISSEFFAEADSEARARMTRDLGPERVYLVAAARNPAVMAVSTWQQVVRTYGRATSLEKWLEKNFHRDEESGTPNAFWARADTASLVARWAEVVPAERITVIVIDENDRRLLPASFEQLLSLPDGSLADQQAPFANRGLSSVEAALVSQIIQALDSRLTWDEYRRTMRGGVIRRLLEVREPGPEEQKTQMPGWALERAVVEGERIIERLQETGVRIVGNLESMRTTAPGVSLEETPINQVPIEMAAEAVVGAIAVATRDTWTLALPASDAVPGKTNSGPKPRARARGMTDRNAVRRRGREAAKSRRGSPRVDAVPTRELCVILAKRLQAGLRRRAVRLASRRGSLS